MFIQLIHSLNTIIETQACIWFIVIVLVIAAKFYSVKLFKHKQLDDKPDHKKHFSNLLYVTITDIQCVAVQLDHQLLGLRGQTEVLFTTCLTCDVRMFSGVRSDFSEYRCIITDPS